MSKEDVLHFLDRLKGLDQDGVDRIEARVLDQVRVPPDELSDALVALQMVVDEHLELRGAAPGLPGAEPSLQIVIAAARNAADALLYRDLLAPQHFTAIYAAFSEVIPLEAVAANE